MTDIAEIRAGLERRITQLVRELLPNGVEDRANRLWRVGSLAGEPGASLAVELGGRKRGVWCDYAAPGKGDRPLGGDVLHLVAAVVFGDRQRIAEALGWAREWLGLPAGEPRQKRPAAAPRAAPAVASEAEDRDVARRAARARALWLDARVLQRGDPVDRYLQGRGIDLSRLRRAPGALRYHPGLRHPSGPSWPAMVAAITDQSGRHIATHRTWLEERNLACEPAPFVGKAPIGDAKMTLGRFRGGGIRLGRGASGRSWAQMRPGETLLIGEGIEDVLSAQILWRGRWRAIAAVSLYAMLSLELPPEVTKIILLEQNDPKNSPAAKLVRRVIERFQNEDREVISWVPPVYVKDINAWLVHRQRNRRGIAA